MISLYIHIPYCQSLCPYCGFYKVKNDGAVPTSFIEALITEISHYQSLEDTPKIKSVFFGGGTPSLLNESQLNAIFHTIRETFILDEACEITLEANPENINTPNLDTFKKVGINRLSIGIQSFNEEELTFLGRTHNPEKIHQTLSLIQSHSPWNYNLDFIYGLPISTKELLTNTLHTACQYQPPHLSFYALSIEPNTVFEKKNISLMPPELDSQHYKTIQTTLTAFGYKQYEVSAYSKENYQCLHNLTYWAYEDFIGIGPSANSFFNQCRYENFRDTKKYIEDPTPLYFKENQSKTPKDIQIQEYIMSNLRLYTGIPLNTFEQRFDKSIMTLHSKVIHRLITEKYLKKTKTHLKTTAKGQLLLNEVLVSFMP